MRLSRFVQSGVAVVAVVTSLMTATAEVSIAAPAAVPAAAAHRPVVSKLSLTSGPVTGGIRVTVTGRYFTKVTRVVFGSSPGKSLKVLSGTELEVIAPGHPAGTVNVEVVAKAGRSKAVAADRFTYIAAPVIRAVSPARGSAKGGTLVTITGSNFIRVTKVTFGGKRAKFGTPSSPGFLRVTAPAGTAGRVDIRVSTAYGTSAANPADRFTYQTVTVSPGGTYLGYHAYPLYSWVHIAVAGFPPDSAVNYTCTTGSSFYQGTAGTTYSTDAAGTTVRTDANGSASFDSAYLLGAAGSVTCTSGNVSGTAALPYPSPWPGGSVSISPGAAAPPGCYGSTAGTCNYVHFVVTNFPANSIVDYGCTGNESAGPGISDTNSAGALAVTDASGYASFDASAAFPSTFFAPPTANGEVSCGTNGIWVTYDS
jgi:large repetitive protein